jgi:hypothetical protein
MRKYRVNRKGGQIQRGRVMLALVGSDFVDVAQAQGSILCYAQKKIQPMSEIDGH